MFLAIGRLALPVDFYFDEMWRVDMAHADNVREQYLQHDTPIPPGWLYIVNLTSRLTLNSRTLLRFGQMAVAALALGLFAGVLRRELVRARVGIGRATSVAVVCVTTVAVAFTSVVHGVAVYFNNYGFEMLGFAAVLWLLGSESFLVSGSRGVGRTEVMLTLLLGFGPLFFLGPLFAWPGVVLAYFVRSRRRNAWFSTVAVASALGTASLAAVYSWFYKPIAGSRTGSIQSFWDGESVRTLGVLDDRIQTSARQFLADGFGGWAGLSGHTFRGAFFVVCGIGLTAAILGRRAWWLFFVPISAFPMAVIGGLAAGWPVTPTRVNVAAVGVLHALTAFGWICGIALAIEWIASRLTFTREARLAVGRARFVSFVPPIAMVMLAATVVAVSWPEGRAANAANTAVYARGLSGDLRVLRSWAGPNNVVLSYHPMSHWYAHHELVNREADGKLFTVFRERAGDRGIYDDPVDQIRELLEPATQIWCVIPYETGPDDSAKACQFPSDRFEVHRRQRLARAELVGVRLRNPAV